jgi:hypothetical protein
MAANDISTHIPKSERALLKLELAAEKRSLVGTAGYRALHFLTNPIARSPVPNRPWKTTPNTVLGLWRSVYSGNFDGDWTWFDNNTSGIEEVVTDFSISDVIDNDISIQWLGYFRAPHTADYIFYLDSDDKSQFWLGDKAITGYADDNWDVYSDAGVGEASTDPISLVAGQYYPIRVQYGNGASTGYLTFSWSDDYVFTDTTLIIDINPGDPLCYPGTGTALTDLTGNGNNLTMVSSGLGTTSVIDNYIEVQGYGGNYIAFDTDFMPWTSGQPFTIHCWFQTNPGSVGPILVQQAAELPGDENGGFVPAIYVGSDNKLWASTFWHGSVFANASTTTVNDNLWHLVTVTFSAVGTQKIYIDGQLESTATGFTQTSYAGRYYYFLANGATSVWPQDPNNAPLDGLYGAFRAHSVEQTAGQVLAYYTANQGNYA